jgi:hypothetical protein
MMNCIVIMKFLCTLDKERYSCQTVVCSNIPHDDGVEVSRFILFIRFHVYRKTSETSTHTYLKQPFIVSEWTQLRVLHKFHQTLNKRR